MGKGDTSNHRKARAFINAKVKARSMAHPNTLPCVDCGHVWAKGERRHEYDHTHDYDDQTTWHLVESVCTTCHHKRTEKREGFQPELRASEARLPNGQFAPGVSPNPGGVSKERRQLLEIIRGDEFGDRLEEALRELVRLRNPATVLYLVQLLAGKPKEMIELTGKDGGPVKTETTHTAKVLEPPDPKRFANIARVLEEAGVFQLAQIEAEKKSEATPPAEDED